MRLRHMAGVLAAALLALPAAAYGQAGAAVTGTVTYRERMMLPPSATVNVQLQDVSRADAAAVVLAEQTITPGGSGPPYAFSLSYDPAQIDERGRYAVRATISDGGQLLFTSTQSYPVITQGSPTSDIAIIVQRVSTSGGASGPSTLPVTGGGHPGALWFALALALLGAGAWLARGRSPAG